MRAATRNAARIATSQVIGPGGLAASAQEASVVERLDGAGHIRLRRTIEGLPCQLLPGLAVLELDEAVPHGLQQARLQGSDIACSIHQRQQDHADDIERYQV